EFAGGDGHPQFLADLADGALQGGLPCLPLPAGEHEATSARLADGRHRPVGAGEHHRRDRDDAGGGGRIGVIHDPDHGRPRDPVWTGARAARRAGGRITMVEVDVVTGVTGESRAQPATQLKGHSTMAEYVLPDLDYDYGALEPHISGEIMELHHSKHHATYVKGAND